MDKNHADKIVAEFMEKIFGFALKKTFDTDQASELASRITYEAYSALLKAEQVNNINGYIYRIAQHVYARYVDEEARGRHISLDNVRIPAADDFTLDIENDETYRQLRRQVSYLGKTRREIVVMHYFDRLKHNEIARRLGIPPGTVKWHLHEAKNQLKGGFQKMKGIENLNLKPIRFTNIGSNGNSMPGKGADYYLSKLITHNIAYAAYWQPRTITEIAEALSVPAAFIEDEIYYLEEYGFLDKLPGGRYQANIYIMHHTKETEERRHELFKHYAKPVCGQYIPLIIEALNDYRARGLYTPKGDINFLLWTIISFACKHKFFFSPDDPYKSRYRVKRLDGGDYIATVSVVDDKEMSELSFDLNIYNAPNNMNRWGDMPVYAWQLDTYYDTRSHDCEDNRYEDYCWLYEHMTQRITKEAAHADKYKRLFDKGYLVTENGRDYVNMVVCDKPCEDFQALLPEPPDILKQAGDELDQAMYALQKDTFPLHMQELCRLWNANCLSAQNMAAYVLTQLLADGTLKPLTEAQKASVNTIMFCDRLP